MCRETSFAPVCCFLYVPIDSMLMCTCFVSHRPNIPSNSSQYLRSRNSMYYCQGVDMCIQLDTMLGKSGFLNSATNISITLCIDSITLLGLTRHIIIALQTNFLRSTFDFTGNTIEVLNNLITHYLKKLNVMTSPNFRSPKLTPTNDMLRHDSFLQPHQPLLVLLRCLCCNIQDTSNKENQKVDLHVTCIFCQVISSILASMNIWLQIIHNNLHQQEVIGRN